MGQQSLDDWRCDVNIGEAHDAPTGKRGRKVFVHVGHKTRRAIVSSLDPDAALDLDERATWEMGEVCAPTALLIEAVFAFKCRAAEGVPVEGELGFEL